MSLFFWTNLTNMCLFPQSLVHTYSYIYNLCMYTFVYGSFFLDNFDIHVSFFTVSGAYIFTHIWSVCVYICLRVFFFLDNFDMYIFLFSKSLILGTRRRDTPYYGCTAVDLDVRERKRERRCMEF